MSCDPEYVGKLERLAKIVWQLENETFPCLSDKMEEGCYTTPPLVDDFRQAMALIGDDNWTLILKS